MSIDVRPGRWREVGGGEALVQGCNVYARWPWYGIDSGGRYATWLPTGEVQKAGEFNSRNLIEYLGPVENSK